MANMLTNWKTSLGGLVLVGVAALHTFAGVNVPGFSMDFGAAVTAGLALLFAQDSGK